MRIHIFKKLRLIEVSREAQTLVRHLMWKDGDQSNHKQDRITITGTHRPRTDKPIRNICGRCRTMKLEEEPITKSTVDSWSNEDWKRNVVGLKRRNAERNNLPAKRREDDKRRNDTERCQKCST
ncbi:hypothetical protein NECAME_01638 [Necator americanus]|uniref:Uncharacterized protein n=1 Tax=Necator americanus TaxID=51031 RepID=W2TTN5_NECAM|nr:hypothetical protein NECAME_01638 [Necator americanus]ETN84412.1 hypothetical protein NECAME_01638 [Necator americanus]